MTEPIVYTVRLRPVMTLGTFDCLHRGHENLFARASGFGRLIVGVNSDSFVKKYKKQFPDETQLRRIDKVFKHWAVDDVFLNDGPGVELIRQHKPELLVIGSDWHDKYLSQIGVTAEELFTDLQCGIVYLPRTVGVSSTELRNEAA